MLHGAGTNVGSNFLFNFKVWNPCFVSIIHDKRI